MDRFDEIVTDPELRLRKIENYLAGSGAERPLLGRFWISSTSGTSGLRAIIPHTYREWTTILASYARANDWSGVSTGLVRGLRMALVSSQKPWHQSARVARSIEGPFVKMCHLDAGRPIGEIVAALNAFGPAVLVAYGSMVRILAEEQVRGRLRISPRAVNSSSEILTPEAVGCAERAWGIRPYDVYAATESGGLAAECAEHTGMHLFEDLVITEVVDAVHRPVPTGEAGDHLLVTVLFSRTLPLIRYELSDRVRLAAAQCPCGRPFRMISAVEGRTDDVLELPGPDGAAVRIHPVVFHQALENLPGSGWQIRQESEGLQVVLAGALSETEVAEVVQRVARAVQAAGGAAPKVDVQVVPAIPTGPGGKRPLIVSLKRRKAAAESGAART